MRKNNFEKILNSTGCSTSADFTAEEKERLFSFFSEYEMKRSTAYNRFFRDGFKPWEIDGVESCVKDYCAAACIEVPEDVSKFFAGFENKASFISYINSKGMSRPAAYSKFTAWQFKKWQIVGIRNLIDRLLAEEVDDA